MSGKPIDEAMVAIRKLARDMKRCSLGGATRSALWYSDDLREYADRLLALAQQPAAVDEAWLSKARSLYDRCSVYPETKPDGMIALLELRNHVYSILATQHQEPTT